MHNAIAISRIVRCAALASRLGVLPSATTALAADAAFGEYLAGECVICHRRDGQDKGIPSIVGWPTEQFVTVIRSYKSKDRPNPVMQAVANRLSDEEVAALAAYYEILKTP